jgi:hypothetical protein
MHLDSSLVLLALDVVVVGCTLHYILSCFHTSTDFTLRKIDEAHPVKRYAYYAFVFIGFVVTIKGAFLTLLYWAPDTELAFDDDRNQFYDFHYKDMFASFVCFIRQRLLFHGVNESIGQA